jgi:NodT family efflux transporter outer membrane factor (OMF) lipoprotein
MVKLDIPIFRMMRIGLHIGVFAALILLGGCMLKQPPQRIELVSQALPEKTKIPLEWKEETAPDAKPVAEDWLKSLNDAQLEPIVLEAIANNPDLRQAAEKVRIAQQSVVVVGAQLFPQLGAAVSKKKERYSIPDDDLNGTINRSQASATVIWELDVWGKLRAQRASSEAEYQATALDYAYARQSLAATVAKVWYTAIEAHQLLQLAEQSVRVFSEQLQLVTIRQTAGKGTDLDVVDTRAKVETAKDSAESTRQAYNTIRRALELLLGRYPAAEINIAATYPHLPEPPATSVPAALLTRRPDIVSAERAVLAAFRATEAAELALLPDFSFSLEGLTTNDHFSKLLQVSPWFLTTTIGSSIPIFEGGARIAQIEIATAQQAQALANYGSVILKAFDEVENALSNEQSLANRLPLNESAVRERSEAVRIATEQYLAGRRDLLWVTYLEDNLITTQAALIKLHGAMHLNRIALLLALGGSFDNTPAAIISQSTD